MAESGVKFTVNRQDGGRVAGARRQGGRRRGSALLGQTSVLHGHTCKGTQSVLSLPGHTSRYTLQYWGFPRYTRTESVVESAVERQDGGRVAGTRRQGGRL